MNLALSALLIILFLLPAFFFGIGIFLPMKRKNEDAQIIHDIISRNVSKVLSKLNFTRRDLRKRQQTSKQLEESTIISSTSFHRDYGDVIHIPGDIFTLLGKEIINLNVKYIN